MKLRYLLIAIVAYLKVHSPMLEALYDGVRTSSYPYISGDTIRDSCDFIMDDDSSFDPQSITKPSVVYVQFEFLEDFFKHKHPHIPVSYVLVSHNSINDYDQPGRFAYALEDSKIIHWFASNPSVINHPKFTAIPIGIANQFWPHGNRESFDYALKKVSQSTKKYLAYVNFSKVTSLPDESFVAYQKARQVAWDYFENKAFAHVVNGFIPHKDYLLNLIDSHFVISPRGHALDCHRTWEALLMGAYPIVISSFLDSVYEDLPVVIVKDWNEVTEEFLKEKIVEFCQKTFNRSKVYAPYWIEKIRKSCDSRISSDKDNLQVPDLNVDQKAHYLPRLIQKLEEFCDAIKPSQLPEPYESIVTMPFNGHGFFGEGNKQRLEEILQKHKPRIAVELGAWLGASTRFIASRLEPGSKLYAVDTWLGSSEHQHNQAFNKFLTTLYVQFLSNVKHAKLTDIIVPLRMKTLEAAAYLNHVIDFIYIDAAHEENDVYNDIMAWYPKLREGGIMCGDDWSFPSVQAAIQRAIPVLGQKVHPSGNFWTFDAK